MCRVALPECIFMEVGMRVAAMELQQGKLTGGYNNCAALNKYAKASINACNKSKKLYLCGQSLTITPLPNRKP